MARLFVYEKFPCGYEYQEEGSITSIWTFLFGWVWKDNLKKVTECPLHGKKCK